MTWNIVVHYAMYVYAAKPLISRKCTRYKGAKW